MKIRHPRDAGIAIDVDGDHVPPDVDGHYEIGGARRWLETFAAAHGVEPESLIVDVDGPEADEQDDDRYDDWTYDELYAHAQDRDISGRSSMTSDELRDALRDTDP